MVLFAAPASKFTTQPGAVSEIVTSRGIFAATVDSCLYIKSGIFAADVPEIVTLVFFVSSGFLSFHKLI